MNATINILYESDFYRIMDFKCMCTDCRTSKPEYSESFCISFVRKGNFLFNVFRHSLDSYSGCVLVTKPGYERTVTHLHTIPDECTILDFKSSFFKEIKDQYQGVRFLNDNDWHSTLLKTNAETEFLHFQILQLIFTKSGSKLQIDNMIMEIVDKVLSHITDYQRDARINSRLKKNHLLTIERAKDFITKNFTNDISLTEIADYCNVSPFHFSRIFKTFTSISPHQFLLSIRLKKSELLLKETQLPVADVAFTSGFNSIEHFTAAFRQKYKSPPATFRNSN
jgi:AraC family transcriptional regulator